MRACTLERPDAFHRRFAFCVRLYLVMARPAFVPDPYTLLLLATVALASFLPASGQWAVSLEYTTDIAIGLLFFLHGAKLSREAVVAGITHWRLHLLILSGSFVLFPLLGLALKPLFLKMVPHDLYIGLLFICILPSTVQSSIAFTSMARGNVPAAVCAASASTLIGIFLTPALARWLIADQPGLEGATDAFSSVQGIVVQLLLPFIAGQLARPLIGAWIRRNGSWLKVVDQGSILLVVYTAFSAAVVEGIWQQVSGRSLAMLLLACVLLLAIVMTTMTVLSRLFGFTKADEITIVFCGSKKSLASGVPMAKVLFDPSTVGAIVLPLMLFHQIQLMVCAVLAQRHARRPPDPVLATPAPVDPGG